jgi:hypothetical protein
MTTDGLAYEARKCRDLAQSFAGRAEQPFLLKAAAAFDQLARTGTVMGK